MVENKSILSCYKISDYTVQDWATKVLKSVDNNVYKENLANTIIIQQLIAKLDSDINIEVVQAVCEEV